MLNCKGRDSNSPTFLSRVVSINMKPKIAIAFIVFLIIASCNNDHLKRSEVTDSYKIATERKNSNGHIITTWETSDSGGAIRRGMTIRVDSSQGISYGEYDSYEFKFEDQLGHKRTLDRSAKVGAWHYFGVDGRLDSVINYQKVLGFYWLVDTGYNEQGDWIFIDSLVNVEYEKEKIE